MDFNATEWRPAGAADMERPSEEFVRAVAELLETDADDILSELGYVYPDTVGSDAQAIEV